MRTCLITGETIPFNGDSRRITLLTLTGRQMQVTVSPKAEVVPNITKLWKGIIDGWIAEGGSREMLLQYYNDPPVGILADQRWDEYVKE